MNVSQQANANQSAEHLKEEPEGDDLVRQVARHQDQLQTDSDFIRHHSQDQDQEPVAHGNRLDHHQQADHLGHQEVDQAELQAGYQTHQVFNLPSVSQAADEKVYDPTMEDQNCDQMNHQAVTGFQLLDVLEDDQEEEEDADKVEEQQVEEEAVEMTEMQEDLKFAEEISKQSNRSFEDIFNEAGSFIDEEDIFMEEYERLDDQDGNDSGEGEDNDEISVVDHFKSIKFAKPIPKWP